MRAEINHEFLISYGFENPVRYWSEHFNQFRVYYKIEGYDCNILVSPVPQTVPNNVDKYGKDVHFMPPQIQVDEFSDIPLLIKHTQGDYHVYVNDPEKNHIATFRYQDLLMQLIELTNEYKE